MQEAWIIDGVRTPRGRGKNTGALHGVHPQELMATTLRALAARIDFAPEDVDDVFVGNSSGTGDHSMCIGRLAVLSADWPESVPAVTVNRYCGSGQSAINMAAVGIMSGQQRLLVAGGVESMSRFRTAPEPMDAVNVDLRRKRALVPQGVSADLLTALYDFSREDVDAFGKLSQDRAVAAQSRGAFDRSIVPVRDEAGTIILDRDELPRDGVTLEALGRLEPSFTKLGAMQAAGFADTFDNLALGRYPHISRVPHVHHAGNSSGLADGASAILVASPDWARRRGVKPRARIVQVASMGSEPTAMLDGPPAAARRCLHLAGLTVDDIDLWEINEAFAVVPLLTIRELGLDIDKVNVNGGAIALGHPIGGTGAMLVQTAMDELERRGQKRGLVTMCTGGGMATATIVEMI